MASYSSKFAVFTLPHLHLAPRVGVTPFEFQWAITHAAVMFPVVELHGKLASDNAQLQKDHIASCTDMKVVQKYVLSLNPKAPLNGIDVFLFYTHYTYGSPVQSHCHVLSSRQTFVPSSYCFTIMVDYCTAAHKNCPVVLV